MKKVALVVIVLILAFVGYSFLNDPKDQVVGPDALVPFEKRPFVSLTPSNDGHWLTLKVDDIQFKNTTLEYLLVYDLPDGRSQGVPGSVKIKSEKSIERQLLLGSESSGNYRYDEGVNTGLVEIKFRNPEGAILGTLSTRFSLLTGVTELKHPERQFFLYLPEQSNDYFVIMDSFGTKKLSEGQVVEGPVGVYTSGSSDVDATVEFKDAQGDVYQFVSEKWNKLEDRKTDSLGIFILQK